ncbi:MAG TPA: PqqD family protein [Bryobacteraceae bacterium]|nr:PqqD family protein [Bryobacteraceae bacterium]
MLSFLRIHGKQKPPRSLPLRSGFRVAPGVKASQHSEGLVLINLSRGTVFSANRAGAIIWNAAVDRWPLERIAESISSEFHVPAGAARDDAADFIAQLAAEGLLVPDAN